MSKITKYALAGMMATALGVCQARASGPVPAPKTDRPAATAAPLTDESLLTMLQNMGYEPKIDKLEKTTIYTVTIDQGGWTYYLDITLSNDKDQLWITSSAADFPADGKVPAEKLLQLLAATNDIGPAAVYYDKTNKKVMVALPLLNHGGITAAVLRTYLSDYMKDVVTVQKMCDFPKTDVTKTDDKATDKK